MQYIYFYNYAVLVLFNLLSMFISFLLLVLTWFFSDKVKNYIKLTAYECGFNSYSTARIIFDVHFFLVALLFLIFDIELIFLYPWSFFFYYLNFTSLIDIYLFLIIIVLGYVYEWKNGILNWTVT